MFLPKVCLGSGKKEQKLRCLSTGMLKTLSIIPEQEDKVRNMLKNTVEYLEAKYSNISLWIQWRAKLELQLEQILDFDLSGGQKHTLNKCCCFSESTVCVNTQLFAKTFCLTSLRLSFSNIVFTVCFASNKQSSRKCCFNKRVNCKVSLLHILVKGQLLFKDGHVGCYYIRLCKTQVGRQTSVYR